MENEDKAVEVFSGELWKATMIKTMLEENHIHAFLNNELLGTVAPYLADGGGMANVKVVVTQRHEDLALNLIDEFNNKTP